MKRDRDKREKTSDLAKPSIAIKRQAVVVIHGIGNQRPMDTLRPFVDALLDIDPNSETVPKYYSKPDSFSKSFELRLLQSRDSRPRTDYLELYWQHLIPSATWKRILAWLKLLLNRSSKDVPTSLRGLWRLSWLLVITISSLLLYGIVTWINPAWAPEQNWFGNFATLPVGFAVMLVILQGIILNYVGDAAIYLSPDPQNIEARHAIREAGVELIERLHEGHDSTHYDRIIIVGHSLGSIIGYDILTYAWNKFNERHDKPARPSQDALGDAEKAAKQLWAEEESNLNDKSDAQKKWLKASRNLWFEQRENTFPWLITDFITLGSPLTHALLLLANSSVEFKRKKSQCELPTCPPQLEDRSSFSYRLNYILDNQTPRTVLCLHRAACFAVTRWTNLFFPARYWLKGDVIGGRIAQTLGPGILDIPVQTDVRKGWLAHTSYWQKHNNDRYEPDSAIIRLRVALDIKLDRFKQ
ncbi:MAG: hypothetical protein QNK31_06570 [Porticoccus sp.]|nr:hypothetical protein [Porticoccus sp.]